MIEREREEKKITLMRMHIRIYTDRQENKWKERAASRVKLTGSQMNQLLHYHHGPVDPMDRLKCIQ
jgi:hypothetical protein